MAMVKRLTDPLLYMNIFSAFNNGQLLSSDKEYLFRGLALT